MVAHTATCPKNCSFSSKLLEYFIRNEITNKQLSQTQPEPEKLTSGQQLVPKTMVSSKSLITDISSFQEDPSLEKAPKEQPKFYK